MGANCLSNNPPQKFEIVRRRGKTVDTGITLQYEVSLSRMSNDILTLDQLQSHTNQFHGPDTELDLHRITSGLH